MSKRRRSDADAAVADLLARNPDLHIKDDGRGSRPAPYRLTEARTLHTPHTPAPEPAAQSIVLPLPPSGNRYWRHYNGRTVVSDAAKAYRHGVMLQAQAHNLHPFAGPVAVYVRVYRARKAGDLDNFKKVLYDALQGVAYNDDDQIVEEHAWRYDDKDNPRVEVEVRQVQP